MMGSYGAMGAGMSSTRGGDGGNGAGLGMPGAGLYSTDLKQPGTIDVRFDSRAQANILR